MGATIAELAGGLLQLALWGAVLVLAAVVLSTAASAAAAQAAAQAAACPGS